VAEFKITIERIVVMANRFRLSIINKACLVALGICSFNAFAEESEIEVKNTSTSIKEKIKKKTDDEVERIEVTGVRGSLR